MTPGLARRELTMSFSEFTEWIKLVSCEDKKINVSSSSSLSHHILKLNNFQKHNHIQACKPSQGKSFIPTNVCMVQYAVQWPSPA